MAIMRATRTVTASIRCLAFYSSRAPCRSSAVLEIARREGLVTSAIIPARHPVASVVQAPEGSMAARTVVAPRFGAPHHAHRPGVAAVSASSSSAPRRQPRRGRCTPQWGTLACRSWV